MNYKTYFIALATIVLTFIVVGFSTSTKETNQERQYVDWGQDTPFVQEFVRQISGPNFSDDDGPKFYVHSFYGVFGFQDQTIARSKLSSIDNVEDLLKNTCNASIEAYESVWVKSMFGEQEISIMGKDNMLN